MESSAESNIFKKKSKIGKNEECTVTVKSATDQWSKVSCNTALIGAASTEKWIGMLS